MTSERDRPISCRLFYTYMGRVWSYRRRLHTVTVQYRASTRLSYIHVLLQLLKITTLIFPFSKHSIGAHAAFSCRQVCGPVVLVMPRLGTRSREYNGSSSPACFSCRRALTVKSCFLNHWRAVSIRVSTWSSMRVHVYSLTTSIIDYQSCAIDISRLCDVRQEYVRDRALSTSSLVCAGKSSPIDEIPGRNSHFPKFECLSIR